MSNKKGFTLVEIMIVVAIIALLAAIAIPNLLKAKVSTNDALARNTLRAMSTAAETYSTANDGVYPADIDALTTAAAGQQPYLHSDLCTVGSAGYDYACTWATSGYTLVATPEAATSGTKVVTIETGGKISEVAFVEAEE